MNGSTYKRCRCREGDGRELGTKCPSLRRKDGAWNPRHGSWYFRVEIPVVHGQGDCVVVSEAVGLGLCGRLGVV
jgi:hypothetical protein